MKNDKRSDRRHRRPGRLATRAVVGILSVSSMVMALAARAVAQPPPSPPPPPADGDILPPDLEAPADAPTEPPPPPAPPAPPSAPAAPPAAAPPVLATPTAAPSARERCVLERRRIAALASTKSDLQERTRLLMSMPDCGPVAGTSVAVEVDRAREGGTGEISVGFGTINFFGTSVQGIGGLNLGFGGFLTPRVALTARLSGVTHYEEGGIVYLGTFGPNIQGWFDDHTFVGGGVGVGLVAACADGDCAAITLKSGINLRIGYSFSKPGSTSSANLSLEYNTVDLDFGSLSTVALLIGYQAL
jgi:hypothetical protein